MLCMCSPSLNYVQLYFTLFYVHSTPKEFENTALFMRGLLWSASVHIGRLLESSTLEKALKRKLNIGVTRTEN